mgnify:CR=1 FL=1
MIAMLLGLPVIGPFLSAAAAVIQVAARICNAIPGAVWAVVLLVALWHWWGDHGALVNLRADHTALQDAVEAQKEQAEREERERRRAGGCTPGSDLLLALALCLALAARVLGPQGVAVVDLELCFRRPGPPPAPALEPASII